MPHQVIIITGASSGFGALTARSLARAGHIVYAGMRAHETTEIATAHELAKSENIRIHPIILDLIDTESVNQAVKSVVRECGQIDTIIHNAGHGATGPAEAFSTDQLIQLFNVNVLGTQRLNQASLPYMRKAGRGLIVWVSSSSTRGGTPPFMGPYFAAKAALDSLAVSYAGELARWGIENVIVVPGAFPKGTNHFANMMKPADGRIASEYLDGPYQGIEEQIASGLSALLPDNADPKEVASAILEIVNAPAGTRPFRVHIDPGNDGAEVVNGMADRVRVEMLRRIGLEDLLLHRQYPASNNKNNISG